MNNNLENYKSNKFSLQDKNINIHKNLWKVYVFALFLGISVIGIKEIFNV